MEFRPCIDIHEGKVKQIVGGSLKDTWQNPFENFVAKEDAAFFAKLYQKNNLKNGHVILLTPIGKPHYEETKAQAIQALRAYPGGLQVGGGMNPENAKDYLNAGASHIIVTSYVFQNGVVNHENLKKMVQTVGKEQLVLDLSCRKKDGDYYIVTDRWQKYTNVILNEETLDYFSNYCDEFLIHAVDVEGKSEGFERPLVKLMGEWGKISATYAGGVHSIEDIEAIKMIGKSKVNVTIGSALDMFGGKLSFEEVLDKVRDRE